MEEKITIYQKPTCTTCRRVAAILQEKGIPFDSVNYYLDPIPKSKLNELLKKMRIPASDLLRSKEALFNDLKLSERSLSAEETLDLIVRYPDLLQRPIVEKGDRAVLARPPEKLNEIL